MRDVRRPDIGPIELYLHRDWILDVSSMYEDWTPIYEHWTPDAQGHRTQNPPDEDFVGSRTSWDPGLHGISWDSGLHGILDFVGFRTSWDSSLRGIQDSTENRTPQHLELESCSVVFSLRTQTFRIKFYKMDTTWVKVSR